MRAGFLAVCALLLAETLGPAAEPFRYPEKKHGKGELKYINGVPVLILAGKPEEMGEQMGVLGVRHLAPVVKLFDTFLKEQRLDVLRPALVKAGQRVLKNYPDAYRREFEAMAKSAGVDREVLLIGNALGDLRFLGGCSALMVEPAKSATGGALMGRNLDFRLPAGSHQYQLVIVYRPQGKRAFAAVSFPGAVAAGCSMSAMNADGLCLGSNEIRKSKDDAPALDLKKMPSAVLCRRMMEECATIAEAEKLARANKPAARQALVLCDRKGGAVLEATPKTVLLRRGSDGLCAQTNHFQSKELGETGFFCPRALALAKASREKKLGVKDVARYMGEAAQGAWTVHTAVFEPKPLKLHVAFGDGKKPATAFPLREVDLSKLLR
jgi:isopenicillin-N N-acyltransferase like protein